MEAEIGIIGGTGMYDPGALEGATEAEIETEYGSPSGPVVLGTLRGRRVAFLPRHGRGHTIAPHEINYRANIAAMRSLGVSRIIAPSAVGSLREELGPGRFVVPDQFVDMTRTRRGTFSGGGSVSHVSMADPFCPEARAAALSAAGGAGLGVTDGGTYICIEGPRFSTRAESRLFRAAGADIIGMTLVPECQLAREARICYVTVASVTDYDAWKGEAVTAREVRSTLERNAAGAREIVARTVEGMPAERRCSCASSMDDADI
ncbi:MAG: S-methyl-5'-thioadenosine phosphorylase [Nitrosopumilus sp.]|nr:S-methyl-5'-thioadenosine phosphorylase [Nitrosopumilus sp.]CAI9832128.1 S-methyl-5'-thioadenosine phosphorylase [Nitrosopumilaceae archaeon]MDA7941374.1 S-methyl-5'-thioadenosine phosphorylase [Nitrosopumilus sp.]MDA7942782.1 S-methyl-5'-thioadenosine phosphorylase [Nitrosopumilus sp.]MDA7945068.1 S-methyl-5'-thioadenosine phosphorylase [Nitrosopumilus sp.]